MRIKRLHSLETFSAQVQPAACSVRLRLRPQVLVYLLQALAIGTHAPHLLGHHPVNGRHDTRAGPPPETINIIVGGQLSRSLAFEVIDRNSTRLNSSH